MTSAYRVWLDGRSLTEVDPSILITDVVEHGPKMNISSCSNARYDGMRMMRKTRQSLSVSICLEIRERRRERRQDVMEKIALWAGSGKALSISTRPGQRLLVALEEMPEEISSQRWTQEVALTFTAYAIPYWEDETPVRVYAHGKSGQTSITPAGCTGCFLEAVIVNSSENTLTQVKIQANGHTMELKGMSVAPEEKLEIRYDEEGLLHLPFRFRTAQSCDDLLLMPGKRNEIAFEADQHVTMTLCARGRRL